MNTYDLARKKTDCEFQLNSFFNHYPLELIMENISTLFENVLPYTTENHESATYLFYEELMLMVKNCALLFRNSNTPELQNRFKAIHAVACLIKEAIPTTFIFCTSFSKQRIDLIIVIDQNQYKPFDEIKSLLDFAILGHQNINCTAYVYGTFYDFMSKGHIYLSSVCTAENCIYKKHPSYQIPVLNPEKAFHVIQEASLTFNQTMHKAITFFNGARQFANEHESSISAFMLQQACELTYRSLLLSLRGKDIKCHDLVVLRKHLRHFAPQIIGALHENEEQEIAILTSIQQAYVQSRYDQSFRISLEEVKQGITTANALIKKAQEIFHYHCQKIKQLSENYL